MCNLKERMRSQIQPKQNKNQINTKLTSENSSQITIAAVGKTADAFKDNI